MPDAFGPTVVRDVSLRFNVPPFSALAPRALSPAVVTVTSSATILLAFPNAYRPLEPEPSVVTLPPLMLMVLPSMESRQAFKPLPTLLTSDVLCPEQLAEGVLSVNWPAERAQTADWSGLMAVKDWFTSAFV